MMHRDSTSTSIFRQLSIMLEARSRIMFITQNGIKLPPRRHQKEFASLTDDEDLAIEKDENFISNACSYFL